MLPYNFVILSLVSKGRIPGDLDVIGSVQDIYLATGQASYIVNVVIGIDIDASSFLQASLKVSFASGNMDDVLQVINAVSSLVSERNCTLSPNCTALNRDDCLVTINTCSSCLIGYEGIFGDSNTKCVKEASPIGTIGSVCQQDEDCLYHYCENGLCTAPQEVCPTSVLGTVCSNNGICRNLDSSGNIVQNCTIVNPFCTSSCLCQNGYGGIDCSFDDVYMKDRSSLRRSMCEALTHVISQSQESPELFDSIASSLLSAYDKDEISGIDQLIQCSLVVQFLGKLASRGFLKGTLPATQQIYAEISSEFVGTRVPFGSIQSNIFEKHVDMAIKGMTGGIMKGMVEGQNPVSVVTSNIRATIISQLVSSLSNATFSPPPTASESAYSSLQPRIVFPGDGVSTCSLGSNYAQILTLQFGTNPHSGSEAVHSPLFQFSSTTTKRSLRKVKSPARRGLIQSNNSNLGTNIVPAYYIILQFSSEQKFNLSIKAGPSGRNGNVTIPVCSLYDATIGEYVSCGNCSISSYTNFNATFGCYDINNVCPAAVRRRRKLKVNEYGYNSQDHITNRGVGDEYEYEYENEDEDDEDDVLDYDETANANANANDGKVNNTNLSNRELYTQIKLMSGSGSADDYTPSADDGSTGSDDRFSSKKTSNVNEFGILFSAIASEVTNILSLNPFSIDLNKAKSVLVLVGSLFGTMIIGFIYFLRWDKAERHDAVYLFDAREREMKKLIFEDLKKGGNGVTSLKSSPKKFNKSSNFINAFNASMISIHSNNEKIDPLNKKGTKACHIVDDETVNSDDNTGDNVLEATILSSLLTVSSYTNFNATFGCYDINNVCPTAVRRERLLKGNEYVYNSQDHRTNAGVGDEYEYENEVEDEYECDENDVLDYDEDKNENANAYANGGKVNNTNLSNRELNTQLKLMSGSGSADDYIPSADDGSSGSDDRFSSKKTSTVNEFGTLFSAIASEVINTLSLNPFSIDLNKAKSVLVLVGSLFGTMIIGFIYFLRWDKAERHDAVYLFDAREREMKKLIFEDLKKGGNGVTSLKSSPKKFNKSVKFINAFNASMISIHSNNDKIDPLNKKGTKACHIVDDETVNSDDNTGDNVLEATILIAHFSNQVLPRTYTVDEKSLELKRGRYRFNISLWADAFITVRRTHYLTAMFYRTSQCLSRTLQFLEMCRKVLLYLFIDTVIYGVFFPSDSTCTVFLRKGECIALPSKVR